MPEPDLRLALARPNLSRDLTEVSIAHMRFVDGMTVQEIADSLQCGRTHVENTLRDIVAQSDRDLAHTLNERRLAWHSRLDFMWKELKGRADLIADYELWLDTIKTMMALTALDHKIASSALNGKERKWLTEDESSWTPQMIEEEARRHGLRIPQAPSQLLLAPGPAGHNPT